MDERELWEDIYDKDFLIADFENHLGKIKEAYRVLIRDRHEDIRITGETLDECSQLIQALDSARHNILESERDSGEIDWEERGIAIYVQEQEVYELYQSVGRDNELDFLIGF